MADLGLMAGLAEGLKQGLGAYQDQRRYIEEQALKNRQLANQEKMNQASMYEKGIQSKQGGGFEDIPLSEPEKQMVQMVYKSSNPEAVPIDLTGATKRSITEGGLLGKAIQGGYTAQGRQIVAQRTGERNEILRQGLDLRRDTQAKQVADIFDKDELIKGFKRSQSTISNGIHTIENPPQGKITNQMLSELGMEIAKGLSGSGVAAQGTIHEQSYRTSASDLAKAMSYITGNPQDVASPQTVDYVKATLGRLNEAFGNNVANRASELAEGREYKAPNLQKTLEKKKAMYTKPQGLVPGGMIMKGKVKVSNGSETLLIDKDNLGDAMKDGYKEVP